jgi:hypothetical protein
MLSSTALIEAYSLLTNWGERNHPPLGASMEWLTRIVVGKIYLGTVLGTNGLGLRLGLIPLAVVGSTGFALLAYCFFRSGIEWRVFLLFSMLVFAASLKNPFTSKLPPGTAMWPFMARLSGIRYWFFPTLAFAWVPVWYALGDSRAPKRRAFGVALLFVTATMGVIRDWRHPAYADTHFAAAAAAFDSAPRRTVVLFQQNPPGWTFLLIKR